MELTLADAIREGAKQTTQCKGEYVRVLFSSATHEPQYEACALGAAAIGIGLKKLTGNAIDSGLITVYPELSEVVTTCPVCRWDCTLYAAVAHLNDMHDWTREAIADWLDSQVLELTPVTVSQETTV